MKKAIISKMLAVSISISMAAPYTVMAAEMNETDINCPLQTSEEEILSEEKKEKELSEETKGEEGGQEREADENSEENISEPAEDNQDTGENVPQQPEEGQAPDVQQPEEIQNVQEQPVTEPEEMLPGEGEAENSEAENQEETEEEAETGSNEELIAQQQIISLPQIVEDFRFWTVAKKYSFAKAELFIQEEMSENARNIGALKKDGVCYILKEENGWFYVESGMVRGFVKADEILYGEAADEIVEAKIKEAKKQAEKAKTEYEGIEKVLVTAEELIPYNENAAFLYTLSTVKNVVAEKIFALCSGERVNIREGKGIDSRIIGTMTRDTLCYILADENQEWVYIESGDVRGFVKHEYLLSGKDVTEHVTQTGEEQFTFASAEIDIKENHACYYTMNSIKAGVPGGELRQSVVEFASQFIGNPYVWGGTSLTEGADCSGFVQSIFSQYGYHLPRTAADQSQYGIKIPVEEAQAGDLIFYAENGQVYHVVICAGNGQTIEAMGTDYGIVSAKVNSENAVWATRVLEDKNVCTTGGGIDEINVTPEQYGKSLGTFRISHYCGGSCCNDEWAGMTSTGVQPVEGDTIAADPNIIPYGTKVIINGHVFTAADCGGGIKENRIDVFVNDHNRANELGVYYSDVYLLK